MNFLNDPDEAQLNAEIESVCLFTTFCLHATSFILDLLVIRRFECKF